MYAALWRHLPGPWPARLVLALAGFAGVVVLLFSYGFPAVEPHLPWSHDTVQSSVHQSGDFQTAVNGGGGSGSTGGAWSTGPSTTPKDPSQPAGSVLPGE